MKHHSVIMKPNFFLFASLVILVFILLSGCSGGRADLTPPPQTLVLPDTPTYTPSPPPINKPTRNATQVPTDTRTGTATVTATLTPAPTLPFEARQEALTDLLSTNGGCDFPCWWGIRRGDPLEKAAAVTSPFHKADIRGSAYGYSVSLGEFRTPDLQITYRSGEDSHIDRMVIELWQPTAHLHLRDVLEDRFSPESILTRYGKPSEVLFAAAPLAELEPIRGYVVFLIYEEQDFGIAYQGVTTNDDPVRICSINLRNMNPVVEQLEQISLFLYDPRKEIDRLNRQYWNDLQPIGDVTTMSVEEFISAFSAPGSGECIESAVQLWQ